MTSSISCSMMLFELLPQYPLVLAPQLVTTAVFDAFMSPEHGGELKHLSGLPGAQPARVLLYWGH
jgi:hypothetical protein